MKKTSALLIILFLIPLTTSAQDFCEGNFDYDDDVDGTDAFTFKTDFGRSLLKNPCPPDGPAPVPKSGQINCYDGNGNLRLCEACIPGQGCSNTGEDGYWQKGVEWPDPRFTNNGDGTVTDNLTGLVWMWFGSCWTINTWQEALNACKEVSDGVCFLSDGSSAGDWRLANRKELESILDFGQHNLALPPGAPFHAVENDVYWSSTTHTNLTNFAWAVDMTDGRVEILLKSDLNGIWCIRSGH